MMMHKCVADGLRSFDSTQEVQEDFLRSILKADQEEENEEAGDMNDVRLTRSSHA